MSADGSTETGTAPWSMAAAVNEALRLAMTGDDRLLAIGEDITDPIGGVWGTFRGLSTEFGSDRVRGTPIAEQAIAGTAIGAALGGYRVVAEIMFFDFVAVCMDQLANHAAKLRYMSGGASTVPITICTAVGSPRFGAQHSQTLEGWFMHTPGFKVAYPSTPHDAFGLMTTCVADPDPCLFVYNSASLFKRQARPATVGAIPLGEADVVRRGDDVTIVAYGPAVRTAMTAADQLAAVGIEADVIDLRTLVPLDLDTVLESVGRTRRAIVVHTAVEFAGPGAEIAASITERAFDHLVAPVARIGAKYVPTPFAPQLDPLPSVADVVAAGQALGART